MEGSSQMSNTNKAAFQRVFKCFNWWGIHFWFRRCPGMQQCLSMWRGKSAKMMVSFQNKLVLHLGIGYSFSWNIHIPVPYIWKTHNFKKISCRRSSVLLLLCYFERIPYRISWHSFHFFVFQCGFSCNDIQGLTIIPDSMPNFEITNGTK